LTARLLRNFTSRFDDGAPAFAGIVFTAAVVASASADDGAPLLPPHSPLPRSLSAPPDSADATVLA
jgi:hypothetical protein